MAIFIVTCLAAGFVVWLVFLIKKCLSKGAVKYIYQSYRNLMIVVLLAAVIFQAMHGIAYRRTDVEDELNLIIEEANKMGVYALYFVDSYGYMTPDDVSRLYNFYNGKLDGSIKIGFHAHNNMNMAYANVIHFMNIADNRPVIVDACATGMGQGAGNLQTEIIVPHLNRINADRYDYNSVLDTCDIVEKYNGQSLWGYSVTRLIPAMHKTAYKYAVALRKHYGLSLAEINRLLSNIPEELRHRYTPENTEQLLRSNGYLK